MICLDVQLKVLIKTEFAQKAEHGCGIKVILVLGRLLGLWLNVKVALEAKRARVIHSHTHKVRHVLLLQRHVGVQQGLIALAATPEDVALAA